MRLTTFHKTFIACTVVAVAVLGLVFILLDRQPESGTEKEARLPPVPKRSEELRFRPTPIGAAVSTFGRPMATNLQIVDLDQDGFLDVIYCEGIKNTVRWIRQVRRGDFEEAIIGEQIRGPAHVAAADIYANGRLDVLVASMGQITPNNDRIGAVVVLENIDNRTFEKRTLIRNIARVTDVRGVNLFGHADGRLDLVVGQFGYAQGETRWMRNLGDWKFESQIVSTLSGCVNTPVADFDNDGRPDFAALISQEWEEIHLFRNEGNGRFGRSIVWGSTNEDFGSSGLTSADVNRDGLADLIYTNGDAFDYAGFGTRPWHGVQWLENRGSGQFIYHRVGDMAGAYAPCAADLNLDGHTDILTVSCFADWQDPDAVSMMAWLNDGNNQFAPIVIAKNPTHLVTAAVGDLDGTGEPVIVTGGFHTYPPYDKLSNITIWRRF